MPTRSACSLLFGSTALHVLDRLVLVKDRPDWFCLPDRQAAWDGRESGPQNSQEQRSAFSKFFPCRRFTPRRSVRPIASSRNEFPDIFATLRSGQAGLVIADVQRFPLQGREVLDRVLDRGVALETADVDPPFVVEGVEERHLVAVVFE